MFKVENVFFCQWAEPGGEMSLGRSSCWYHMARSAWRGKASLALQRKLPWQAFRWPVNVTFQPRAPWALLAVTSGPGS